MIWGTTSGGPYPNETSQQAMDKHGAFSFDLTGLDPGTVYCFQAKAVGDGIGYGIEKSFTTLTMPPVVTTNDATSVAVDIVRLNGTLDDLGTALSVNVTFVRGITSGGPYPNEAALELMDAGKAYSFDLVGLTRGTYYFQAKAIGDGVGYGVEKGFTIPVTFPDSNLEVAIREAIDKPEGAIYLSDLQSLTDLVASQKGVSNISGLEYCSNLQGLVLTDNNVGEILPLSGLTSLKWLDLVNNNISDISPLTGLASLDWLPLGGNSISDISPLVMNSGLSEGDFATWVGIH